MSSLGQVFLESRDRYASGMSENMSLSIFNDTNRIIPALIIRFLRDASRVIRPQSPSRGGMTFVNNQCGSTKLVVEDVRQTSSLDEVLLELHFLGKYPQLTKVRA